MSPQDERAAILRHLTILEAVKGSPSDLDEFLGLPEGTTERVRQENRQPLRQSHAAG
jgi:hypothetical protein